MSDVLKKLDETGFEFPGADGKRYLCRMIGDQAWLCYWGPDGGWVTLRAVTQYDVWRAYSQRPESQKASPEDRIEFADQLRAKFRKDGPNEIADIHEVGRLRAENASLRNQVKELEERLTQLQEYIHSHI